MSFLCHLRDLCQPKSSQLLQIENLRRSRGILLREIKLLENPLDRKFVPPDVLVSAEYAIKRPGK